MLPPCYGLNCDPLSSYVEVVKDKRDRYQSGETGFIQELRTVGERTELRFICAKVIRCFQGILKEGRD